MVSAETVDTHEGRQWAGTIKGLGAFPGLAFLFEPELHVSQRQVQRQAVAENSGFGVAGRRIGQWAADQHGQLGFKMNRALVAREVQGAGDVHRGGCRFDKQQGLIRNRVVQLPGMFRIVTTDADDFAQGQVNRCSVFPVVLIVRHGRSRRALWKGARRSLITLKRANSINLQLLFLQLA